MDIYFLNLKKLDKYKNIGFLFFVGILLVCFAKLFYCSISIDGANICDCMVADYYNFAKNMLGGKTLYKDLLDHKGIYLYIIYIIGMLISNGNPIVVPILETIVFTTTILACYYTIYNLNKSKNVSLMYTFIFSLFYFIVSQYTVLVNTEGLLAIAYFFIFSYVINHKKVTPKAFFLIGLAIGFFVNIKYVSILSLFGLFIYVTFLHFYNQNGVKQYLKSIIAGLMGALLVNIPFIAYLLKTNTTNYYMSSMLMASGVGIDIVFVIFCIGMSMFMIYLSINYYKKEETIKSIRFLALSCAIMVFIGGMVSSVYISYILATLVPFVFYDKKIDLSILFYIGIVLWFFSEQKNSNLIISDCLSENTKTISQKYGIDNSNIFYLTEDIGFGIYEDETFVEPYQWIPFRYFKTEKISREIIELEKDRLRSKRFEFVFVDGQLLDEKNLTKEKTYGYEADMYREIAPILIENYEPIDQCLWRRKDANENKTQ